MALVAALALATGCGEGESAESVEPPPGPIPVDSDPIARDAYAKPLGAAVEAGHAHEDAAYRSALITRFTSITPENAMKWSVVQPERGEFDFAAADVLIEFARRAGKRVRGHPLVWDVQLPGWLEDGDWSRAELRRVMRDHIRTLVRRYRDDVDEWDVVNEPLADDGSLADNVWLRTLGPGWVAYAFRVARRADPDAKLFLNEIDAELPGPKSRALLRVARRLKRDGEPIDGVGFQNHTTGNDAPGPDRLRELFREVREIGLSVAITEMDVGATVPSVQARVYREAAEVCAEAPHCTSLTVWGVTDPHSWLGADAAALPLDAQGEPKPAFEALVGALRE